jgi:hypothetical protein
VRLAREQADHIAIKNASARRELVPAARVEAEWSCVLRTLRSPLLAHETASSRYSVGLWEGVTFLPWHPFAFTILGSKSQSRTDHAPFLIRRAVAKC